MGAIIFSTAVHWDHQEAAFATSMLLAVSRTSQIENSINPPPAFPKTISFVWTMRWSLLSVTLRDRLLFVRGGLVKLPTKHLAKTHDPPFVETKTVITPLCNLFQLLKKVMAYLNILPAP